MQRVCVKESECDGDDERKERGSEQREWLEGCDNNDHTQTKPMESEKWMVEKEQRIEKRSH